MTVTHLVNGKKMALCRKHYYDHIDAGDAITKVSLLKLEKPTAPCYDCRNPKK